MGLNEVPTKPGGEDRVIKVSGRRWPSVSNPLPIS